MTSFNYFITCRNFDIYNDNIDVEIKLDNGDIYFATFFTLANIKSLFEKNKNTGECSNGLYLWACDMILVETLSEDVVEKTIKDLIDTGEIYSACSRK